MSVMTSTPTRSPLPCARCHREGPIVCCWCDRDLCAGCTPAHLQACSYAKARVFRTRPPTPAHGPGASGKRGCRSRAVPDRAPAREGHEKAPTRS